jgi:mannose-6-phosphate isomerase-like protein (cupin superfamily)
VSTRIAPAEALAALARNADGAPFKELFQHGTLSVEVYRPIGVDRQSVHSRDELYVVIAGRGTFLCGDLRLPFAPGDLLFVAAGMTHRFEDFTDDFSTWVVFYGPEGGEKA